MMDYYDCMTTSQKLEFAENAMRGMDLLVTERMSPNATDAEIKAVAKNLAYVKFFDDRKCRMGHYLDDQSPRKLVSRLPIWC